MHIIRTSFVRVCIGERKFYRKRLPKTSGTFLDLNDPFYDRRKTMIHPKRKRSLFFEAGKGIQS